MNQKNKIKPIVIVRRAIQIVSFLLMPGLFTSIFYAMKNLYVSIISGKFSFSGMAPELLLFVGSILLTLLLGRFFCGFLCSFGAMGDFIWFLSQKIGKGKWRIGEKTDKWLKTIKYVLLAAIIVGLWTFQIGTIDSMANPWVIFGMYSKLNGWSSLKYFVSVGGALLLIILIGSIFVERFFCRYLCPLGAVFAIVSKVRIFQIRKTREHCGACRVCTKKCSMRIPLYQYDTVVSGECINCMECMVHCPRQNVKTNAAPVAVSALSAATMFGLFYAGNVASAMENNSSGTASIVQTQEGIYTDGTYTGSGQGFRGETKTSVIVENGNITDISIISYEDDSEYFNRAKDTVIEEIIESQDVDVDAVSGATFSSNGIMASVADALGITGDTSSETNDDNSIVTENPSESPSVSSNENSDDSSNDSQATNGTFQDGTYTGTGTGFRGDTEVTVTVEDSKITDITISSYEDDQKFFERAKDSVIEEIIESQDVDVDAVSGATFSSNGIMEAVANALGVSFTNPNSGLSRGGHGH